MQNGLNLKIQHFININFQLRNILFWIDPFIKKSLRWKPTSAIFSSLCWKTFLKIIALNWFHKMNLRHFTKESKPQGLWGPGSVRGWKNEHIRALTCSEIKHSDFSQCLYDKLIHKMCLLPIKIFSKLKTSR